MVEFSKNKWKYSTIGLLAILAAGFSFPQAFAAPIDSVLTIVRDIQAKINSSTFGLQAINDNVLQTQSALSELEPQTLTFNIQENLTPFGTGGNSIQQNLIAVEEGKTFSGHASISVSVGENVLVRLFCGMPNGSVILFDQTGFGDDANEGFACTNLHLTVINQDDEDHFVTLSGVVQYQTNTNIIDELP
jgi:hypothetical protein